MGCPHLRLVAKLWLDQMSDESLKLTWRHTWPERGLDFVALDPENCFSVPVARIRDCSQIYLHASWTWVANHPASGDVRVYYAMGQVGGYADTKREAAELAEAAHFRFLEAIDKLERRHFLEDYDRARQDQDERWRQWASQGTMSECAISTR